MGIFNANTIYHCTNDCKQSGCPGHKLELSYNSISLWFELKCDEETVFSGDLDLLRSFYELLKQIPSMEIRDIFSET
jgi:hypothetical protein